MKGGAVLPTRAALLAHVASGDLARERLEARLGEAERALLDVPELPPWVPVASCDRLLHLLAELEGDGEADFLARHGERSVEAIAGNALYGRLRELASGAHAPAGSAGDASGGDWFERLGHALVTVPSVLFDRGSWKLAKADAPRLFTLAGEDLGTLPATVTALIAGALGHLSSRALGRPVDVAPQRAGGGRVLFVASSP